jgi:hypothetical protein
VSNTDFVNSGSYLRTVFVFISGITSFTGFAGVVTNFLGSAAFAIVLAVKGGVEGGTGTGLMATDGTACLVAAAVAAAGCGFAAGGGVFDKAFPPGCTFEGAPAAGFDMVRGFFEGTETVLEDTTDFDGTDLEDTEAAFLTGWTTFLATGLAILLATGPFLADLLPPDDWAGLATGFLAGAIFFPLVGFLAVFAAFFLVAIRLGFFSDKHF